MIPRLVAICGYKRCGKDTLANYISSTYGHDHLKIAGKLKHVVRCLFGFTEEQVECDAKELVDSRWGITPRRAMQFVGTEMFQYKVQELLPEIQRTFWVKSMVEQEVVPRIAKQGGSVVISDLRFVHEYIELKKHGVFVIMVERDACEVGGDSHASETEFKDIPADVVIKNNSDIRSLLEQLEAALVKLDNTVPGNEVHVLD